MPYITVGKEIRAPLKSATKTVARVNPVVLIHGYPLEWCGLGKASARFAKSRLPGDHVRSQRLREGDSGTTRD